MARITVYEATDGLMFKDRKVYLEHARNLVAAARIQALIEAQIHDAEVAKQVAAFYACNVSALRELVNSKDISLTGEVDDDVALISLADPEAEAELTLPADI